jgi:8-hydroxy-5-deazaflavin:NADPH oxidoreductase
LLEAFGHTDVIDLGDITSARGTEMYLPLWLRLMGSLKRRSSA